MRVPSPGPNSLLRVSKSDVVAHLAFFFRFSVSIFKSFAGFPLCQRLDVRQALRAAFANLSPPAVSPRQRGLPTRAASRSQFINAFADLPSLDVASESRVAFFGSHRRRAYA